MMPPSSPVRSTSRSTSSRATTTPSRASTADVGKALDNPAWEYEHLDMNQAGLGQGKGHPALKDPIVRKAIEQALDKTPYYLTVFPGPPVPGHQPLHERHPVNYWQLPDAECPASMLRPPTRRSMARATRTPTAMGSARCPRRLPLVFDHCTSSVGFA